MLLRSPKQLQYQTWLSIPPKARPAQLRTRAEFAAHFGVDEYTLLEWEQEHGWWADVFAQARSIIGNALPAILESMVERAVGGNVPAMKLCLETLGVRVDAMEIKHKYDDDQLMVIVGNARPVGVEAPGVRMLPEDDAIIANTPRT